MTELARATTFDANPSSLGAIPDGTSGDPGNFGSPRNVTFDVSGFASDAGETRVSVTMQLSHPYVGDLEAVLISPNGVQKTIFSRTGAASGSDFGDDSNLDGTYTFVDSAPSSPTWWGEAQALAPNQAIPTGFYRASTPGPGGGADTSITTAFGSATLNGAWTLRIRDGTGGDTGAVTAASLDIVGEVVANPSSLGAIPDSPGPTGTFGSPRDVTFSMSGLRHAPTFVALSMTFNPAHTWVGDLEALLIAPDGTTKATIFSRTGAATATDNGDNSDAAGPYRFFDGTANSWWDAATTAGSTSAIPAGSYRSSGPGSSSNTLIDPAFAGVTNPNGTWTLRLRDASHNDTGSVSAASLTLAEGTDTSAPAAPEITGSDPPSPGQSTAPRLQGTAEAGSVVRIHTDPFTCNDASIVATGTAADFAGAGIQVPAGSGVSEFAASAMDASGNVSGCSTPYEYAQDSNPPAAPTLSGTTPASPSSESSPLVGGSAESGSTVKIYGDASCSGSPLATGSAAEFGGAGIETPVTPNGTTTLYATATDAAANVSACAGPLNYVEDSFSPTPTLTGTDPDSPANDNFPKLQGGGAESGATVYVFAAPGCQASPAATGTAAELNGAGIEVQVPGDSASKLSVTAVDALGNVSGCSNVVTYVEDSEPPTTTVTTRKARVKTRKKRAKVRFTLGSSEPGSTFACSLDGGKFSACESPVILALKPGKHKLAARATDAAGNLDETPAKARVKVKRKRRH